MRGKAILILKAYGGDGITPAHAGKSMIRFQCSPCRRDHPRTCGEKNSVFFSKYLAMGSPPHMRGKESAVEFNGGDVGITPAHAGKSHPADCRCCVPGDHPRTCGEKVMNLMYSEVSMGSPPHMRGKVEYSSR